MRNIPLLSALLAALAVAIGGISASCAEELPAAPDLLPQAQAPADPFDPGAGPSSPRPALPNDQAPRQRGEGNAKAPQDAKAPPDAKAPQDREAMLAELYTHLAQAKDAEQSAPIAKSIEGLWAYNESPTVSLLMARASKAVNDQRPELALKLLDAVVELSPDYAEGWSRRAYVYYMQSDVEHAAGDLRRALALEPRHYKALEGLARILRDGGQKKSALGAYQQLLRIYPFLPDAQSTANELSVEVEGQGI